MGQVNESRIEEILRKNFNIKEGFRNIQKQVILSILSGKDILAIMPTGSGKSLCFQLPAVYWPGTTFVVSPLIALMYDQVKSLKEYGIASINLDGNLSKDSDRYDEEIENIKNKKYKIVYLTPERLLNPEIQEIIKKIDIPLVVVDEAHCVSEWGHDFRPKYQDIPKFVENIVKLGKKRPVVAAFTATATEETRKDVLNMLKIENAIIERMSVARTNLNLIIIKNFKRPRFDYLLDFINERKGKNGIIYCATRRKVHGICRRLNENNIKAVWYHRDETWWQGEYEKYKIEKEENFEKFMTGKVNVMVATTAFGMGVNKEDVHYTVHFHMPLSIEGYYQAAGRAGRKLEKAESVYYYVKRDYGLCKYILERKDCNNELDVDSSNIERRIELLDESVKFAETKKCLQQYILEYFGEDASQECGECSNCNEVQVPIVEEQIEELDVICSGCGEEFTIYEAELRRIRENNGALPTRCKECDLIAEWKKRDDFHDVVYCRDCGCPFPIYKHEYLFFQRKGWALPTRCKECSEDRRISDLIAEWKKRDDFHDVVYCRDCGCPFPIYKHEYLFFQRRGWELPIRCKKCREIKKIKNLMR
jgi:ATP-dependent DNA helicase RecQ